MLLCKARCFACRQETCVCWQCFSLPSQGLSSGVVCFCLDHVIKLSLRPTDLLKCSTPKTSRLPLLPSLPFYWRCDSEDFHLFGTFSYLVVRKDVGFNFLAFLPVSTFCFSLLRGFSDAIHICQRKKIYFSCVGLIAESSNSHKIHLHYFISLITFCLFHLPLS